MNQERLTWMANLLNANGWNYTVTLLTWSLPANNGIETADYIRTALGSATIVGKVSPVQGNDVIDTIKYSLTYLGDRDHGPLPEILLSQEFLNLQQTILDDAQQNITQADSSWSFTLLEGHPAYPVFWDFSYILVSRSEVNIIIGSASD